jgi:hypothetical protein
VVQETVKREEIGRRATENMFSRSMDLLPWRPDLNSCCSVQCLARLYQHRDPIFTPFTIASYRKRVFCILVRDGIYTLLIGPTAHRFASPHARPLRSELRNHVTPPLATHIPLALTYVSCHSIPFPKSRLRTRAFVPLTSVMYPAVPNIAGTNMTYANESQAVRRVQRKYL